MCRRKEKKDKKRATFDERFENFKWKVKSTLERALFPRDVTCDNCGEELVEDTRYCLCGDCIEKLPFIGEHRCEICGVKLFDEAMYCIRCENQEFVFEKNRSPFLYDGIIKKLVYKLKFDNKPYLAETLGKFMADEYKKSEMRDEIVVFVPMTEAEEKKRGYNQAELLASTVAKELGLPLLPALMKTKNTHQQKELNAKEREQNLEGAFICVFSQVKNRKILLIDDVFTTGATANVCSKVLLKAGAKSVDVLTIAVAKKRIPYESPTSFPDNEDKNEE